MQSLSTPPRDRRARLLVVELWGLGDVALAMPFLGEAVRHARVTLLAKPHAASLLRQFCPEVELLPFSAPWTAFEGKYRVGTWPWLQLSALVRGLRSRRFAAAVSARPDPRDHALLALSGANLRAGFPRAGSGLLLTDRLGRPHDPHRAAHWRALAERLGWELSARPIAPRSGRKIIIHTGAARPTRIWPPSRYAELATQLRADGWDVTVVDDSIRDVDELLKALSSADRFIGNDSGPGHLAALLGVPTFTIFGPQLPELFAPQHPGAAWVPGAPCPYKPCFDACRFPEPHCLLNVDVASVLPAVRSWLRR